VEQLKSASCTAFASVGETISKSNSRALGVNSSEFLFVEDEEHDDSGVVIMHFAFCNILLHLSAKRDLYYTS
jgi:hypothetical protein